MTAIKASRPRVMGVVNVTPDSFSDGGRFLDARAALAQAKQLIADGADILDIGGESTRPGATPVSEADEMAISSDTMKPAVARAAMAAGATLWNDVAALRFAPDAPEVAAALGCEVVLMHMLGEPGTMQDAPAYDDVVAQVEAFLLARAQVALGAGVARERIWLDPGIGFGKTPQHNLALIAALPRLVALGYPILLGASRKRFIAALDPLGAEADQRLGGSIAVHLAGASAGVAAVRVHDVRETVQALAVWAAVRAAVVAAERPKI
ncbi:MAG: dihydropteroate synthase [bacterium]|nr:dihydropteroate synthase [bacterium]